MLNYVLILLSLSVADISLANCPDSSHGGVHIVLPDGERVDECELDPCAAPMRPWYMHEHFDYYDDRFNPTYEVEAESAWPGQREEFSDFLLR